MHFSRLSLARLAGLAIALFTFFASAAFSQTSAVPAPDASALPWETFASQTERPRAGPVEPLARLLFLRPDTADNRRLPASLLVNERLHTALLPGGFSEVDVCAGPVRLSLGSQGTSGLPGKHEQTVQARAGQTTYVLVQGPHAAEPLREATDPEQARLALSALRRQTHAVSRVPAPTDCAPVAKPLLAAAPAVVPLAVAPPPAAAPAPSQQTRYTLSAEMLFRFSGSKPQDLSEQGQTQIVRMARQIKQQLKPGQAVLIKGHTDPTGSVALNKQLSQERAETVKRILVNSGLPAQQLRAEGMGASELLVKDCIKIAKTRDQKIDCNRPNRRVEITVAPLKN